MEHLTHSIWCWYCCAQAAPRTCALQDIGCATLFATHFHELTALHGECGVCNLHVSTAIDEASGSLTMLYQVGAQCVAGSECERICMRAAGGGAVCAREQVGAQCVEGSRWGRGVR